MGFQRAPGGCAAVPPPRGRGFRNGGGSSAALPSWRQRRPAGRGRSAPPAPRSLGGLEESPPRRSPPVHSTDLGRGGRAAAGGAGPGEALPLMRGDQRGAAPPAPRPRGPPTARLRHCAPWRPRRGTAARRAPLATRARSVVLLISFSFIFFNEMFWEKMQPQLKLPAMLGSRWCRLSSPSPSHRCCALAALLPTGPQPGVRCSSWQPSRPIATLIPCGPSAFHPGGDKLCSLAKCRLFAFPSPSTHPM